MRSESTDIQLRYLHLALCFFLLCSFSFPFSVFTVVFLSVVSFLTFYLTKRLQRGKKVFATLCAYCCIHTLCSDFVDFAFQQFPLVGDVSILFSVHGCYFIIVHANSSEQNQVEHRIVVKLFVSDDFLLYPRSRDTIFLSLVFCFGGQFFCSFHLPLDLDLDLSK